MSVDESMPWQAYWNANSMLTIQQDQSGSPLREGDEKPTIYFERQELPKLIAELRQLADDLVDVLRKEASECNSLATTFERVAREEDRPQKRKGADEVT